MQLRGGYSCSTWIVASSIVGNILLVLGATMMAGGLRHREQTYNPQGARPGDHADARGHHLDPTGGLSGGAG